MVFRSGYQQTNSLNRNGPSQKDPLEFIIESADAFEQAE